MGLAILPYERCNFVSHIGATMYEPPFPTPDPCKFRDPFLIATGEGRARVRSGRSRRCSSTPGLCPADQ